MSGFGHEQIDLESASGVVRIVAAEANDRLGLFVASCDVNGDGIPDLIAGAEAADGPGNMRPFSGEAYVVFGRRGSWSTAIDLSFEADVRILGEETLDSLGGVACGDIDGDGIGDIIVGAKNADGPENLRESAGQVHVILGGNSLPTLIDLALSPGVVIYGPVEGGLAGRAPSVGDINSDGTDDIVVDVFAAPRPGGSPPAAGRAYVLFGRTAWPNEIDTANDADVEILGADESDDLGLSVGTGDLDGNGVADLLVGAPRGDDTNNSRHNAGEVHVFLGRDVWPTTIDLSTESADSVLVGSDPGDQLGRTRFIAPIGDLDNDGEASLVIPAPASNGINNAVPAAGEVLTYETAGSLPPHIDMSVSTSSSVYGGDSVDLLSDAAVADINGDDVPDLIVSTAEADGDLEQRVDSGETLVYFGGPSFPIQSSISASDEDIRILGAKPGDRTALRTVTDLNGDGIPELTVATDPNNPSSTNLPMIMVISPIDSDSDGIGQLVDNCPLVTNPAQADTNQNSIGDQCEHDYDGDGQQDATDCAPNDPAGGIPDSVSDLRLYKSQDDVQLTWSAVAFADEYHTVRGVLSSLAGSDFGSCQNGTDDNLGDTFFPTLRSLQRVQLSRT